MKLSDVRFECLGEVCYFVPKTYAEGNGLRLDIMGESGPMAVLSVNVPNYPMSNNRTFVCKNYSENVPVAEAAFNTGIFKDTGMKIPVGYATCPIWTFADDIEF